jgi:hypothetical protein
MNADFLKHAQYMWSKTDSVQILTSGQNETNTIKSVYHVWHYNILLSKFEQYFILIRECTDVALICI